MDTTNLFYRRPDLYDEVRDSDHAVAKSCAGSIAEHNPEATSVLDLGCGTGRDLEYLARRFSCVGVDAQPRMIQFASTVRPQVDLRVGDLRDVRLGQQFDVVLCLGNTLAYLHRNPDLRAAFNTFATHMAAAGVLIVNTLTAPVERGPATHRVETANLCGQATISYEWDAIRRINTMRRVWRFDDGTMAEDVIRRRVLAPDELNRLATRAGFRVVELEGNRMVATFRPECARSKQ